MTDKEIYDYLKEHNFTVNAQDFIINVLNKAHQINDKYYNFDTQTMTITTPDNSFTFKWCLGTI